MRMLRSFVVGQSPKRLACAALLLMIIGCSNKGGAGNVVNLAVAPITVPQVAVTELGTVPLPAGTPAGAVSYCWPRGINNGGVVVGYCDTSAVPNIGAGQVSPFRFKAGEGISALPLPSPAGTFFPMGVNAQEVVAGSAADDVANWNTTQTFEPGPPSSPSSGAFHRLIDWNLGGAQGINGNGQVVGFGFIPGTPNGPGSHIFRISSTGQVEVSGAVGGPGYAGWGFGFSIDENGDLAGASMRDDGTFAATLYTGGAFRDLNTLIPADAGWNLLMATGIKGGNVVGYGLHDGRHHAFRYSPDGSITDLGFMSTAGYTDLNGWAIATSVNAKGHAVGAIYDSSKFWASQAFFYSDELGGMVALDRMVDPSLGWTMSAAFSINDNDEIVGLGKKNGVPRAFLLKAPDLRPCPPSPDECHGPGVRGAATGECSYPAVADGTGCDDGDACTQTDTCQAGVCASGALRPECAISPSMNWKMYPHFVGMDDPPAEHRCPPLTLTCVADGAPGCRTLLHPLCDAIRCEAGSVDSCVLPCGSLGVRTCLPAGVWEGGCHGFERCNGRDDDCDGVIDNGGVCQLPHSVLDPEHGFGWDTELNGCDSVSGSGPIVDYQWDIHLPDGIRHVSGASCRAQVTFLQEDRYPVTLTVVTQGGRRASLEQQVVIKNHVIVSMGDSIASGEGNPDVEVGGSVTSPVWRNRRCHRSLFSWHAQASQQLEIADDHTSVTFLELGCSGAKVDEGILQSYKGEEPDGIDERPQLDVVEAVMGQSDRPIDALLVQIGANDVGFAERVTTCAIPSFTRPSDAELAALAVLFSVVFPNPAFEAAVALMATIPPDADLFGCDNLLNKALLVDPALDKLPDAYQRLSDRIRARLGLARPSGVYIAEYPDPTHSDDGSTCGELRFEEAVADGIVDHIPAAGALFLLPPVPEIIASGLLVAIVVGDTDGVVSRKEASWAHDNVLLPLNAQVANAAVEHNWTFVSGLNAASRFGTHGYCAAPETRWFRHFSESKKIQLNANGGVHPNRAGHSAYADLLFPLLARDLAQ
jgi:probable HAF family extracellular repeat protein